MAWRGMSLQCIRDGEEAPDQMPGIDGVVVDLLLDSRCRGSELDPEENENPRIVIEVSSIRGACP